MSARTIISTCVCRSASAGTSRSGTRTVRKSLAGSRGGEHLGQQGLAGAGCPSTTSGASAAAAR
ncbi:hypothetical protein [Kutzneria kofuensis]|uniref:hypothetical protein n=1 Tax=Kutzneria kofuensis TaxID=103725 RepID=UPI0031EBDA5C